VQSRRGNGISFAPEMMRKRSVENGNAAWLGFVLGGLGIALIPILGVSAYATIGAVLLVFAIAFTVPALRYIKTSHPTRRSNA
jgi:hypothetical protein